jgi:group I intron endonuclease
MKKKNRVIYCAINKTNGKSYVGLDTYWPNRKSNHKTVALKTNKGYVFHEAIRKYGWDNFEWSILQEVHDEENIFEIEKEWIKKLNPNYNLTEGGEGRYGEHSMKTKKKISDKLIGNKNALNNTNSLGYKHTEEMKKKISEYSKKHRAEKFWSTKKKNGEKIIAGGFSEWTKEQLVENGKKVGSLFWWTNGTENRRSMTSPGDNWYRGKTHRK